MSQTCTASGTIKRGDAVCLSGWDTPNGRPFAIRATPGNLTQYKTVYGVASADASGMPPTVLVLVAGDAAAQAVTSLPLPAAPGMPGGPPTGTLVGE
jgi:hypothetical protein